MRSAFGLVVLVSIWGCGSDPVPATNDPPATRITGAPVESDEVHYRAFVYWTGEDPDGAVRRFEYALDPPDAFTSEEIAGGTLPEALLPGRGAVPDTTRVSKVVDGEPFTYDWIHTRDASKLFVFRTPDPESLCVDPGVCTHTGRHTGFHKLYVRAVDDDGAAGPADRVAFTAVTQVPATQLVVPGGNAVTVGPRIRLQFTGDDPDGPSREPEKYVYKVVAFPRTPWVVPPTAEEFLIRWTRDIPWIELPPGQEDVLLDLEPDSYAFGVRAVDEAGAVDPFLAYGENAVVLHVQDHAMSPQLVLHEFSLGPIEWTQSGAVEREVPARLGLDFEIQCAAESYGEVCVEVRWSLDLVDPEKDDDWSEWGPPGAIPSFTMGSSTVRVLHVQARDSFRLPEGTTTATLVLEAVPMPLDLEVLFVDDSKDATYPRDEQHDAFWRGLFEGSGRFEGGPDSWFDAYGKNDSEIFKPQPPSLALLGRHRLVVWEVLGSGYNGFTALSAAANGTRSLRGYLLSGGKLWLGGRLTLGALSMHPAGNGDMAYPKVLTSGDDFATAFLRLGGGVRNDKGAEDNNTLERAIPWRVPETYPLLEVERDPVKTKLHPALAPRRGVAFADALVDPIFTADIPGFTGKLDSLYAYGSYGPSAYNHKLCATRWHDPDPARDRGRVLWFGFPLYYMKNEQAQEVFNRSIDWFREEEPRQAGSKRRLYDDE